MEDSNYKIRDAFASYLLTNSPKKSVSSQKIDRRVLAIAQFFFTTRLGLDLMNEIRVEHLEQFEIWAGDPQACGDISKESWSNASILRHGKTIKSIFRKAFLTGRIQRDPTALWKLSSSDSGERRRPMTDAELERLIELAEPWFQPIMRMLGATGTRASSLARLTWSDIDFALGILYFRTRKGGLKREKKIPFPLIDGVKEALPQTREAEIENVFLKNGRPVTAAMISTTGHRLIRKAGFKGVVLYGLRHKFATDLLRAGTSTEIARRLMGHSNEQMLKQYSSHLGIESLENAVNLMRKKST